MGLVWLNVEALEKMGEVFEEVCDEKHSIFEAFNSPAKNMKLLDRMNKRLNSTSEPAEGATWAPRSTRLHDLLLLVTQMARIDMDHALVLVRILMQAGVPDAATSSAFGECKQLMQFQSSLRVEEAASKTMN